MTVDRGTESNSELLSASEIKIRRTTCPPNRLPSDRVILLRRLPPPSDNPKSVLAAYSVISTQKSSGSLSLKSQQSPSVAGEKQQNCLRPRTFLLIVSSNRPLSYELWTTNALEEWVCCIVVKHIYSVQHPRLTPRGVLTRFFTQYVLCFLSQFSATCRCFQQLLLLTSPIQAKILPMRNLKELCVATCAYGMPHKTLSHETVDTYVASSGAPPPPPPSDGTLWIATTFHIWRQIFRYGMITWIKLEKFHFRIPNNREYLTSCDGLIEVLYCCPLKFKTNN